MIALGTYSKLGSFCTYISRFVLVVIELCIESNKIIRNAITFAKRFRYAQHNVH